MPPGHRNQETNKLSPPRENASSQSAMMRCTSNDRPSSKTHPCWALLSHFGQGRSARVYQRFVGRFQCFRYERLNHSGLDASVCEWLIDLKCAHKKTDQSLVLGPVDWVVPIKQAVCGLLLRRSLLKSFGEFFVSENQCHFCIIILR